MVLGTLSTGKTTKRPTLSAVAKHAGVSATAASFVLNGQDEEKGISKETKRKVLEAAMALNYSPDYFARALRGKSSQTLGVLWSFAGPHRADQMIRQFTDKALESDYITHIFDSFSNPAIILKVLIELANRKIDGVILQIASEKIMDHPGLREALQSFRASVVVGHNIGSVWRDQVNQDRVAGVEEAVRHLANSGRRKIVVLAAAASQKGEVVKAAWQRLGKNPDDVTLLSPKANNSEEGLKGIAAVLETLKWGRDGHDALMCSSDEYAMVAMGHLQQGGVRVPEEVAVIGSNDSLMAAYYQPPLASIERRDFNVAEKAMEMLLARLATPDLPSQRAEVTPHFVLRRSAEAQEPKHQPKTI